MDSKPFLKKQTHSSKQTMYKCII